MSDEEEYEFEYSDADDRGDQAEVSGGCADALFVYSSLFITSAA
jgi:hypothetical protein